MQGASSSIAATGHWLNHYDRRYSSTKLVEEHSPRFALPRLDMLILAVMFLRLGERSTLADFDLGLDLDGAAHQKPFHAHRRARVLADLGAVHLEDEIGEPVDDVRLPVESRCRVDHAEDPKPRAHAI